MIDRFLKLVPERLHGRSGSVFYSGRSAFSAPAKVYLLGLNPGGNPVEMKEATIGKQMGEALARPEEDWSAYVDESWNGKAKGGSKMQPRIQHMMNELGVPTRRVPASNVVFVRSARESDLQGEKQALLDACWPVHQAVIETLGVRTVLCLGGTAGSWVRERLGAHTCAGKFVENNNRRWTSEAHLNGAGIAVVTLTHPSIAAWQVPATDPTPLVLKMLQR